MRWHTEVSQHERQPVVGETGVDPVHPQRRATLGGRPADRFDHPLGHHARGVPQEHRRAGHHVHAGTQDPRQVVERLGDPVVGHRRVHHAVRVQREQGVGVVRGGHPEGPDARQLTRVPAHLVRSGHPDAGQRECRAAPRSRLSRATPCSRCSTARRDTAPSTSSTLPVRSPPAGEARSRLVAATSCAVPIRRRGVARSIRDRSSLVCTMSRGRRRHRADGDRVDPDPRREVAGGQLGELSEGRLRRAVGEEAPPADPAHDRRHVDDRAATAGRHDRHGGPGERVRGGHVEAERLFEDVGLRVEQRSWVGAAEVVDHDVQPPEPVPRRPGQRADSVHIGQIGGDRKRPPAGRGDYLGDLVEIGLGTRGDTTAAPASASATAVAAPIPRPAPVTTATWSVSRNRSRITRRDVTRFTLGRVASGPRFPAYRRAPTAPYARPKPVDNSTD